MKKVKITPKGIQLTDKKVNIKVEFVNDLIGYKLKHFRELETKETLSMPSFIKKRLWEDVKELKQLLK